MAVPTTLSSSVRRKRLLSPPPTAAVVVQPTSRKLPITAQQPAQPLRSGRSRRRSLKVGSQRADDSSSPAPFEMSVENALKLLGVSDGATFDEILRAKNAILATCKDDQEALHR